MAPTLVRASPAGTCTTASNLRVRQLLRTSAGTYVQIARTHTPASVYILTPLIISIKSGRPVR